MAQSIAKLRSEHSEDGSYFEKNVPLVAGSIGTSDRGGRTSVLAGSP